jgi:hypothetical protein
MTIFSYVTHRLRHPEERRQARLEGRRMLPQPQPSGAPRRKVIGRGAAASV